MLTTLNVRNIVLIEHLDLEFSGGLSVLTGETGAGKSILLDALGLSIGARAEAGLVRAQEQRASVTATFDVNKSHPARALLDENDIADEDEIILRRTLSVDGRSRAYINDQPVSVGLMRQLGEQLLEVHGQFDDRGLMDRRTHRAALDEFGGLGDLADETRTAFNTWQMKERALADAMASSERIAEETAELERAIEELSTLAVVPGEERELAAKRTLLMNAEQLIDAVDGAMTELDGTDVVSGHLRNAARLLERVAASAAGRLDGALGAVQRAHVEVEEALHELQLAAADFERGDEDLSSIEDRLFGIRDAARKFGVEVDELPNRLSGLEARLAEIADGGSSISALRDSAQTSRAEYVSKAEALNKGRLEAAARLDTAVMKELPPLKLERALFETQVVALSEEEWGADGIDRVEFMVATNPGAAPGPLGKIASGGELSRFMLALKIALVGVGTAGTLIFDEVDSGVGGATADAVGERLERLGAEKQILVVTHSPQVAARGDDHLKVEKQSEAEMAATLVSRLQDEDRREKVARMLSGQAITDEARGAADRLMQRESA
ncbi:MAG: DNA repair protein RecN [Rhodospirillaceae bacterium]|nr:DNA repair protein RecN [Rhodospirillaceae bacterium]